MSESTLKNMATVEFQRSSMIGVYVTLVEGDF